MKLTRKLIGRLVRVDFWIVLGLYCFLLVTIFCVSNTLAIQGKTVTTRAKIVFCKIDKEYSSAGSTSILYYDCTPTVRFKTNSGQEIDVVSSYGLGTLMFYEGKTVTVSYAPNHPQQALITSIEFWSESIFWGGSGLILFIIGIIMHLWRVKKKKRSSSHKSKLSHKDSDPSSIAQ